MECPKCGYHWVNDKYKGGSPVYLYHEKRFSVAKCTHVKCGHIWRTVHRDRLNLPEQI